ncbi:MAG: DUF6266 family protein [Bacteroidota bacterium]
MAHLHTGIMGPISGKIGNLVYYTSKGKNLVRRAPGKSKKKPTAKQLAQREKFGEAMRFISPISKLINESYKLFNRRHSGTNVLVREILKDAMMGKYPHFFIDYEKVSLIRGNLPWSMASLRHLTGTSNVDISWQVASNPLYLEDELLVLLRCSNTGNWFIAENVAQRAQGSCTIQIEAPIEKGVLQVWLAFRSPDHSSYSNSEYLGEVITDRTLSYEN